MHTKTVERRITTVQRMVVACADGDVSDAAIIDTAIEAGNLSSRAPWSQVDVEIEFRVID